jgi:YfiH family protein
MAGDAFIIPDWPAPQRVRALITTRAAGDQASNDGRVFLRAHLPAEPLWLRQVHGTRVVDAANARPNEEADAAVAHGTGPVLAIMTADCLSVLLCDRKGTVVAAAHAGWRGLAAGVLENTVSAMRCEPRELMAFIGPGISRAAYEVGPEVRESFVREDKGGEQCFSAGRGDRFYADLPALARRRLAKTGIMAVLGSNLCTFNERDRFYSYRRDGVTGRMASLIWLEQT